MEASKEKVRIDRWLWAVRLYKTRGQAAEACRGGKVKWEGETAKPSRMIGIGDRLTISQEDLQREVEVVGLLEKRVGAKRVAEFMEDLTPPERFERRKETLAQAVLRRDPHIGRPTKRDRRQIERLLGERDE